MKNAKTSGADLVEIRIDLLSKEESQNWFYILQQSLLPVIVTNRASWEGGKATEDEPDRLSVLIEAVKQGAQYIDVELKAFEEFKSLCEKSSLSNPFLTTKLILSHHNFERALSEDELAKVLKSMDEVGADICKVAMNSASVLDNCLIFKTLQSRNTPTIIIAMGEFGQISRVLAPKFGSYLTFAAASEGMGSAPGQIDTHTLTNQFRFRQIDADTPVYGVIGNPVSHSMSPALHNAALSETKRSGVYVPLRVENDFGDFVRSMTKFGFEGFSVTIPGKVDVMSGMDEMDEIAKKIGAMNTVVRGSDGTLKGYNTDWIAAISAIEEKLQNGMHEKVVVCLGAGGAGRGLAFGALERGAKKVIVVNRTKSKAESLASELGADAIGMSMEEFGNQELEYDVLMNSTSVGMSPNTEESPVPKNSLRKGAVVFDAVYNPLETKLLKDATVSGCITVSGVEMFIRQAAEQFRLWFPNEDVPVEVMRKVVIQKLTT